jgi:hypothetical protein
MRRNLIIFTALALLLSCNSTDKTKTAIDTASVNQQGDTTGSKTAIQTTSVNQQSDTTGSKIKRHVLIEELKQLKAVLASNDKEKIADIFQFPLSDTTAGIYIDDSSFNLQLEKNGGKTTRAMFIQFFPQVSKSLQIDELYQLFKQVSLDSLLQKDELISNLRISTEPCFKFYSILVQHELVTLSTGSGVNESYQSTSASEDEENSSEFCEHILWWVFRFDGERLRFIKQHGAG